MLFLLAFLFQVVPSAVTSIANASTPVTLQIVYPAATMSCTYTPETVPTRGAHLFTLTDNGAAVTAKGFVDPISHGQLQARVLYKPTTSVCPTITAIQ